MSNTGLKKRLIPKLLIKQRRVGATNRPVLVTTREYRDITDIGDPVSQAKIYEAQLADELVVLNIDSTPIAQNEELLSLIERLASETFMPLAVGGGVRQLSDFSVLLERGADKVCLNTAAVTDPRLIGDAAGRFGAQCVVVSLDFRTTSSGRTLVYVRNARECVGIDIVECAAKSARAGAGEILLTDADRDGTGLGLNCTVSRAIVDAVSIPVILSGGCGLAQHFVDGFQRGGADAIAAGTFFCLRDQNPMQTRSHIKNAGVAIRMGT